MKRILVAIAMAMSTLVFAEASFQQVETLIEQKNYQAAEMALEGIIGAHPNSAKAYYAMAQAQAGLGNLGKAQFALNKARSFDPSLKFATSDNIQSLEQAITPQTKKIEVVEESHFWRNLFLLMFVGAIGFIIYHFFIRKNDEGGGYAGPIGGSTPPRNPIGPTPTSKVDRVNSQPLSTPAPASYTPTPSTAVNTGYAPSVTPAPTVVNNHYGSSNDGLLTGMVIGNMMSGGHHHDHHDTTIIRETVREVPAAAPRSSWDRDDSYTPAPKTSRDSSWDDDSSSSSKSSSSWESSSPSRSSSWDSDSSSSSSSSSWSSSSSSDSSSSWSSSDSGSSSSWD